METFSAMAAWVEGWDFTIVHIFTVFNIENRQNKQLSLLPNSKKQQKKPTKHSQNQSRFGVVVGFSFFFPNIIAIPQT